MSSFTFCSWLQKMHFFCSRVCIGHSRSSKVDDFGTNRKYVYNFLLALSCTVSDTWRLATYWLKIANPCLIWCPQSLCSLWTFVVMLTVKKPQCWGYPRRLRFELSTYGAAYKSFWHLTFENHMVIAWVIMTQYQRVTDGQTDGWIYHSLCRAMHSKLCWCTVKTNKLNVKQ